MVMDPREDPFVQTECECALRWADQSRAILADIQFTTTNRLRISNSYYRLAMDHQIAVILMVEHTLFGSAKAMLRPLLDAFARGVWFKEKATDDQIRGFLTEGENSRVPPPYPVLFKALDEVDRFEFSFTGLYKTYLPMFHDFTHGGLHQIGAYNTANDIQANFTPEDIAGTLRASATLGWLACSEMAENCDRNDLAVCLRTAYLTIYMRDPVSGLSSVW